MRIGLIGLGRIGAFHAETVQGIDGVDLIVTDVVPELTERVATKLGVATASSPAALLESDLDGVVIAAATDAHPALILAAVEAGLPVFCEKPVARSPEEAAEVLRRCAGAQVQIGYNRRFDPGFEAAREAVRLGELGRIHTVRSTTLDPAQPPAEYLAGSGGIFRDCAVHDFDIAVGWDEQLPMRSVEPGVEFPGGTPHHFFMDRFAAAYRRELTAFTELVAGERESPCTIADAVEAGWIAEACTLSLHEHRPVRMSEVRP